MFSPTDAITSFSGAIIISKTIYNSKFAILKKLEVVALNMQSRFTALENFSEKDSEELQQSKVAIVGLGATGSVIAEHLARHGIELVIIDRDYLEEKEVYSSSVYMPEQCEKSLPKAIAAEKKLSNFTEVEAVVESLHGGNTEVLDDVDLIMDGTDNLETRFLINEYSKKNDVPWIYTAALAEQGYSMFFNKECFNCLFEKVVSGELDTCESEGILREVSTRAASKSAETAVKYLTGKKPAEKLWRVGGEEYEVESQGCEVCRGENFPEISSGRSIESVCGENKYQLEAEITEDAFDSLRENSEVISDNEYLTRAEVEGRNFVLFRSGRAIIEAKDRGHAESIFSEIIGI